MAITFYRLISLPVYISNGWDVEIDITGFNLGDSGSVTVVSVLSEAVRIPPSPLGSANETQVDSVNLRPGSHSQDYQIGGTRD